MNSHSVYLMSEVSLACAFGISQLHVSLSAEGRVWARQDRLRFIPTYNLIKRTGNGA
jgi:hypothetical protein